MDDLPATQLVDGPALLVYCDAAVTATHAEPVEDKHAIAEVSELGVVRADLLEALKQVVEVTSQACVTAIDPVLDHARHRRHPLALRVPELDHRIELFTLERFEGLAHDLHVLLRHRLLRQAHRFEGIIIIEEELFENDATMADRADDRVALLAS